MKFETEIRNLPYGATFIASNITGKVNLGVVLIQNKYELETVVMTQNGKKPFTIPDRTLVIATGKNVSKKAAE